MPLKWRQLAAAAPQDRDLSEAELEDLLEQWCPPPRPACLDRLREAAALASYRARPDHVRILVGDDAKQANYVSDEFGLCWIHEGRHYKELSPVVPQHEQQLETFRTRYWDLYRKLQEYQDMPTPAMAEQLREEFGQLFATRTGYEALDERIAMTGGKKESMLTVLAHPETPLNNNPAELGERVAAASGCEPALRQARGGTRNGHLNEHCANGEETTGERI